MTETKPGEEINLKKITDSKGFYCTNFLNDIQYADAYAQ